MTPAVVKGASAGRDFDRVRRDLAADRQLAFEPLPEPSAPRLNPVSVILSLLGLFR